MRKVMGHFDWRGRIETLEDRRVMSATPLLGGGIEHHAFADDEIPPVEHQLVAEPDFWLDVENLVSLEDQLYQIEQSLYSAHNSTGLNSVVSNYGFSGVGQTVAIIDSGIAYDHFALGGGFGANYRVVGGWDFTEENDADPYDDGPSGGHGTHVAGIVGGTAGNDKGVAPGVDLVALRVFNDIGDGYFSWVENALKWVIENRNSFENPITAINLSLGVSGWNSNSVPGWSTLEDEFAALKDAGIFIAVSAGNSFGEYNAPGLSYPAASPHVVPVMSVTDSGAIASYSQRDTRAIGAPGSAIRSTVPDYRGNNNQVTDDYALFSGTSMAAPYIAGASVLVREAMEFAGYTNITQDTIYDHMMSTAISVVDSVTGLTFQRLNLQAAIDALMPADDYGSTVATAHNMGSLTGDRSLAGTIGTVNDVDYFRFTASATGRVSLEVSDTTHYFSPSWTLANGSGTLSNDGATFSFEVVAGQTYTVGLSSSSGIGHYSLDVSTENTISYVDWGAVSYAQLNGLAVDGEAWYRVVASQTGYLTVEGLYATQSGQVSLQLYDSAMQSVLSANSYNGTSRVDAYAVAGQEFYIRAVGTNPHVDYRLSNLVSVSGTTVNVAGTSGDDTFSFTAGSTHTIVVNGVTHAFSSIAVNAFNFNGGAGSDTIAITGTAGNESATLRVGSANFTGAGFVVNTANTEYVTIHGGGGEDRAIFYDTLGDDTFVLRANSSTLYGNGYSNEARGFKRSVANATAGGFDRAIFYDTPGDDTYISQVNMATMYGNDYYYEARGFERSIAYATAGGFDRAIFYDTPGDDTYISQVNMATMYGNDYYYEARGFERSIAYATAGGFDRAIFYDTPGDDTYVAQTNLATMYGTDYYYEARGFDRSVAYATAGGYDRAVFYDTPGDDTYVVQTNSAVMYGTDYYYDARGFDRSIAHATAGGYDRAFFYDTPGDDTYVVQTNSAVMYGSDYYYEARGFDRSVAHGTKGGYDRAFFYDTPGDDTYVAQTNSAVMYGADYYYEAKGFNRSVAYATGGNDKALLYDSTGDDSLIVRDWGVSLIGQGSYNEVRNFKHITAQLINGGKNTVDSELVDYIFDLVGQWN